uniref:Uncharacterized protein n=1 Tax=Stomoxys calcitrans TaxID=35570 RepID=A0A1I8P3W5_STOCA
MNPSSSSSFSSPPLFQTNSRPASHSSSGSNKRETPSIIPLDYNYQVMAPSSLRPQTGRYGHTPHHQHHHIQQIPSRSTTRQSSNPEVDVDMEEEPAFNSLFGDPVPPPPPDDFLGSTFSTPAFMRSTSVELTSDEDQIMGSNETHIPQRLFPQVPYATLMGRRYSSASSPSPKNFEILPSGIPRLKPPDIQILPNSSGDSSSGTHNSPNYRLLTPNEMLRNTSAQDVVELKETYTISDGHSLREFSEATTRKSSITRTEADNETPVEMDALSPPQEPPMPRQFSNESYSSGEWFRTANMEYPEFNKMPKLRPSSKNVMSIKRDEMPLSSPVAAMINDSNGSSSGGEEPPSPSPSCLRSLEEAIVLTPRQYIKQRRKSFFATQQSESMDLEEMENRAQESIPAPPIPPQPLMESNENLLEPETPLMRERSPVILKDSITTGGDYRVDQSRLHKKTSFTIINEKSSAQSSSQALQSPRHLPIRVREHSSPSFTPPRSMAATPRQHMQRKSLSSTQLKLPHLMPPLAEMPLEDSPRPSVQFDMTGRYSPSKQPTQKGILHQRDSLSSTQDVLRPTGSRRRSSILPTPASPLDGSRAKSCETLPMITDPYRTAIPRLNRSSMDLKPEKAVFPPGALPRPLKPNPNPTRKHKGLLKVINHEEVLTRIPLKSNWASMDDLSNLEQQGKTLLSPLHAAKARRRSSSTSPSRRSSTQTTSDRRSSNLSSVTTSDFSFRRPLGTAGAAAAKPSSTPQRQRRKSVFQLPSPSARRKSSTTSTSVSIITGRPGRAKIAKPTPLSPIIGTPNKDSSSAYSPTHVMKSAAVAAAAGPGSDSLSDATSRRDSISKIPVRSQANSRSSSRMDSQESKAPSRAGSPQKEATGELARRLSQVAVSRSGSRASQEGSRAASRAESRGGSHSESRAASRTASRTESRAASRAESRGGSRSESRAASRAESRVASRAESRAASRSTSRASTRPISLPGSRPTSRMEQAKEMANSRSNSRLSIHSPSRGVSVSPTFERKATSKSPQGRRKSISLSPHRVAARRGTTRRGSTSPVGGKAKAKGRSRSRSKTRSSPEGFSRSRIPVTHKDERSSSRSSPRRRAGPSSTNDVRRTSSFRVKAKPSATTASSKQTPSAKKMPSSVRKAESSVRKTTATVAVKPQGPAVKREVSNLRKPALPKREASNVAKKTGNISKPASRQPSSVNMKKKANESKVAAAAAPGTKKPSSQIQNGKKPLPTKPSVQNGKAGPPKVPAKPSKSDMASTFVIQKNGNAGAATAAAAVAAADVATLSTLKRQPSSMSLMRVSSKISLLGKKRSDSNLSKKTLELNVPQAEGAEKRASSPTKLQTAEDGSSPPMPAAAILEKSQKTLENIQKTVTEATDEIHKTINENLTDLKSFEQDMGLTSDSGASPTPSVTTVVEKKSGAPKAGAGDSISRLGTAEDANAASGNGQKSSPLPPSQPIEAAVSVLNAEGSQVAGAVAADDLEHKDAGGIAAATSERSYDVIGDGDAKVMAGTHVEGGNMEAMMQKPTSGDTTADYESEVKRRSPDGQGGSHSGSGKG